MKVNLVIPRHKYRSLDGTRKHTISLSPEGEAALDRLATCSRSSAVDLAIRVLDAVIFGDPAQLRLVGEELSGTLDSDGLAWSSAGLEDLALLLDTNLKIPTS